MMVLNKIFFLLVLINTALFCAKIGDTMTCETSTVSYEYVQCKEINKVVRVNELIQEGWIAINSHSFYITFKKIANSLDAMQCLESAQFPNYIGACKSNVCAKSKTWLKKDAVADGWEFTCTISDTVYYYKQH